MTNRGGETRYQVKIYQIRDKAGNKKQQKKSDHKNVMRNKMSRSRSNFATNMGKLRSKGEDGGIFASKVRVAKADV